VLGKLLGDAFNAIKDEEERRNGVKRAGRRPPRFASLEVVVATVFPERYSMDPFPEAMRKLLGERSQRAFAHTAGFHQTTISKLMKGDYKPDMAILERIADAAKVSPGFFREYRALYVAELVRLVLDERPHLSSAVLRDLMNLRNTT